MTIPKALFIALVVLLGMAVLIPMMLRFSTLGQSDAVGFGLSSSSRAPGTGLVFSSDEGETWANAAVAESRRPGFPSRVWGLFYHPQKPETVFLGSKGSGLWRSDNGGKVWKKMIDKSQVLKPNSDVYKIAVSRSNPKVLYLAVYQDKRGRVLKSLDEGENFQEIYFVNASRFGVFDLQINPVNPENVLIVTGQGGVLETQNGGKTWRVKKWFGQSLMRLLAGPSSFFESYIVSSDSHFYKTFDGGEEWEDFTENLRRGWNNASGAGQNPALTAGSGANSLKQAFQPLGVNLKSALDTLTIDSRAPNILYVGMPNSILRSYDGGISWAGVDTPIPPKETPISLVAVSPRNSALLFVGAGNQIYKSSDNGVNWKIITVPIKRKMKTIYINPLRPSEMLAVLQ